MNAGERLPVYIFECVHVCTGTFAIAAMEGTDGRGKWTPVPEEYCGVQDQSAAYVPPWAPVTHYSTWRLSSTSPSWTSPPRHLSPRTDNPPHHLHHRRRHLPVLLRAVSSPALLLCYTTPKKWERDRKKLSYNWCYMLLFGTLGRQTEAGEMTQLGE